MKKVTQHGFATEINILTSNVVFNCLECITHFIHNYIKRTHLFSVKQKHQVQLKLGEEC